MRWHKNCPPDLIALYQTLVIPLPVNKLRNKLAPIVLSNIAIKTFLLLVSFSIFHEHIFNKIPVLSIDLNNTYIFNWFKYFDKIFFFISKYQYCSFRTIDFESWISNWKIFFYIPTSVF